MALDAFIEDPNLTLEGRFKKLFDDVQECKSCRLHQYDLNMEGNRLLGHGNTESKILFVAQNPSFRRVKFKEPKTFGIWDNKNDRLFIENLAAIGIPRAKVFVTNIVKCSTISNEAPSKKIIKACQKFVMREVTYMKPRLIVAIGGIAKRTFKAKTAEFTKWSGIDVFSIWHPSYILRQGQAPISKNYVKQSYLAQFRKLAEHPAFEEIKREPFEAKGYP